MTFSVVIPTYNEEKRLGACLAAVMGGTEVPDEIIVADGNSMDRTLEVAAGFGVRTVHNPKRHAAGGRNAGLAAAKGDVIVFLDADCVPDVNWLKEIKHAFLCEDIDGLGTYIEPAEPENKYEDFWGTLSLKVIMSFDEDPYYVTRKKLNEAFITASCAYSKKLLLELGGFSDWFANNAEDIDLCWRALDAGARLKYEPRAKIKAHSPTDLKGIKKKGYRNGVSSSKLQKVYGKFFNIDFKNYKRLGKSCCNMLRGEKDAYLYVIEILWHLMGKYAGSFKAGVINL